MSSNFQVGDEVVCVDVNFHPAMPDVYKDYVRLLVLNQTYVVAEVRLSRSSRRPVLCFDGILWGGGERFGYAPSRFRKVQKKLSGMSVLLGLLKTKELVDG